MEIEHYVDEKGNSPFRDWLKSIKCPRAKSRIFKELTKLESGLLGDPKSLGQGLYEKRLHFDDGYRLYYGYENKKMIVMLIGSTKKNQTRTIKQAKELWAEYKKQKAKEKLKQRRSTQ